MPASTLDESLLPRLPLPLAQLCRRAHNARTALERHLMSFYLWEASVKLLSSVAVVEYVRAGLGDPQVNERLKNLARPALGHWWELIRLLVPLLVERGDTGFLQVRDLVLGRSRDDLPRAAGLDAALRQALGVTGGARATVRLTELFDRVVQYRNKAFGHGATGAARDDFHQRMGEALLAGAVEVLGHLDVLAGQRLLHVGEIKQVGGQWIVQRHELTGETARRLAALELPRSETARLPDGDRVYLVPPAGSETAEMVPLHPLMLFDAEAANALFLNSRRGRSRTEYLCYTTGNVLERADLVGERRALLAQALGMAVAEEQERAWAEGAQREEEQEGLAEEIAPVGPRRIGEFELLSELGHGGMGVVYRAWQPSLRRQVALKTLLQVGDVRSDSRFRREIRALGRVDHPNLVKVHTSGSDGEHWFYAMELVEGVTLADVSARLGNLPAGTREVDLPTWQLAVSTACEHARKTEKPLSDPRPLAPQVQGRSGKLAPDGGQAREGEAPAEPDQALPLAGPKREEAPWKARQEPRPPEQASAAPTGAFPTDSQSVSGKQPVASRGYVRQIAELARQTALAAHALHEAGVLHRDIKPGNVMVNADGTEAVLMDLGLAQLADDVEGRLTRTRQFVGTLRYASPEQLGGASLDRRADVYSLGATLWELLALRPLFGVTEQTPTPDLVFKLQRDEPERLRRCVPAAGRDLEAIVHRCLEKDAKKRYATALELADDLGRYLNGEPVRARPVRGWERALKWVRRRPTLAGMAAAIVLTLVAGIIVSTLFGLDARDQGKTAHDREQDAIKKGAEAAEALGRAQRTLAVGLLRPLGHSVFVEPLNDYEMDALEELASLPPEQDQVRILFIDLALADEGTAVQLDRRLDEALIAAVGLRRDLRQQVLEVVAHRMENRATPKAGGVSAQVAVALDVDESPALRTAAGILVEEMGREETAFRRSRLAKSLAVVAGKLTPADSSTLASRIVRLAARTKDEDALRALSESLAVLAAKLTVEDAPMLASRIVEMAATTTDARTLGALAESFAALAGKLSAADSSTLASRILDLADGTWNQYALGALAESFAVLAGKLTAAEAGKHASTLASRIVEWAARTKDVGALRALTESLVVVAASKLPEDDAFTLAGRIVQWADGTKDGYALRALAETLAALAGKLPAADGGKFYIRLASHIVEIVELAAKTETAHTLGAMAESLAAVAGKLRVEHASMLASRMVEVAAAKTTDARTLGALAESFAALAGKLETKDSFILASSIVEVAARTTDARALAKSLAAVAGKLTSENSSTLASRILDLADRTKDEDALRALARSLAALAGKLPAADSATLASRILDLAARTKDVSALRALAESFAALAGKLTTGEAGKHASLIAKLLAHAIHKATGDDAKPIWDTLARVVALLGPDDLLDLLKQPGCTNAGRMVLLAQLAKHYKQTFRNVWDLAEYVERHDPDRSLSAPLSRQRPRPAAVAQ